MSKSIPRIALMFSGQPRAVTETFPFIKKHLLDKNPNVDVFIHCWYDPKQSGIFFKETSHTLTGSKPNIVPSDVIPILNKLYKPVAILTEEQEDFSSRVANLSDVPLNKLVNPFAIFSAWTSRQKCNNLVTDYEKSQGFKYDYVINTRTDCLLWRDIKLSTLPKEIFHIHGHDIRGTFGLVDPIYVASSEQMRSICSIANHIEEYVRLTGLWNAEAQLLHHLAAKQIPVSGHHWFPILVRGDGVWPSIRKSAFSYLYAAFKDILQDTPLFSSIYGYLYQRYRGPKMHHAQWTRNSANNLLSRL